MTLSPCGSPTDVALGNALSEFTYASLVRRADLVEPPPAAMPDDFRPAAAFGAIGDGKADDTAALQHALDQARRVWLEHGKVYRISSRLILADERQLLSDGTATLLMAAGDQGFANRSSKVDGTGIFSEHGTGLSLRGRGNKLQHFFLIKEYEDARYVIGIEIVAPAADTLINRVRLRGFSLAPGIITLKSAKGVTIKNSVIHAAYTESTLEMLTPDGKAHGRYQITGIVLDDQAPAGPSENVVISNNVITELLMKNVGRGDQTDGINVNAGSKGAKLENVKITYNHISNVAEGVDTFGHNVLIEHNAIEGRELAVKLIHGAADTRIERNWIRGRMSIAAIKVWASGAAVNNVAITENVIDMRSLRPEIPGVAVDMKGPNRPAGIAVERNRFLVNTPKQTHLAGHADQDSDNVRLDQGVVPIP